MHRLVDVLKLGMFVSKCEGKLIKSGVHSDGVDSLDFPRK